MSLSHKRANIILLLLFACSLLLIATSAYAGTTGIEFEEVYQTLRDWTSGYLGRAVAMASFIVGLGFGIARSSPAAALTGIAIAFFVMVGPNVLDAIAAATI